MHLFRLPVQEKLLYEVECSYKLKKDEEQWIKGLLYLTDHFAAFHSSEEDSTPAPSVGEMAYKFLTRAESVTAQSFSFVIPFSEIIQITR